VGVQKAGEGMVQV